MRENFLCFVNRSSQLLKRAYSSNSKADYLFDALKECRKLRFTAQHIDIFSGHPFSASSTSPQIFDSGDGIGSFQNSHQPYSTKLRQNHYDVKFENLFQSGFGFINGYLSEKSQVDDDNYLSLGALLTFLNRLDLHQESLKTLTHPDIGSSSLIDSETAIILAVHLLSKLSIDECTTSYHVSNQLPDKYKRCPCDNQNCKQDVIYGNTFIGSEFLFCGHPDIVVFPKNAGSCAVVVPKRFDSDSLKKTCSQSRLDEVKRKTFRNKDSHKQIANMSIAFAFYQRLRQYRKKLELPTSKLISVIPTIAIDKDYFDVYMYDTENDIFLVNSGDPIPLWGDQDKLSLSSILTLWMVLNHQTFQPEIPSTLKSVNGSCENQGLLDTNRLEMMERTLRMSNARDMPFKVESRIVEQAGEIEFGADSDSDSE